MSEIQKVEARFSEYSGGYIDGLMTVKRLMEILSTYPPDMPIIQTCCSDYCDFPEPDKVLEVVFKPGYWERYFPNQYPKDQQPETIKCLHFPGN